MSIMNLNWDNAKKKYSGVSCNTLILEWYRKIMDLLMKLNFLSFYISSLSVFFIMIRDEMFQDH